jgi:aspartate/tyrosine/aromatic aminotransferase
MRAPDGTISSMPLFTGLSPRPPDSILGLMEEFRADPRPGKVSLASGVYVEEDGVTPVLESVRQAESRVLEAQTTKVYKPIAGDPAYLRRVLDLVFGADHPVVSEGRVQALHTPGGTGALRVAADLLRAVRPEASVWLTTPTWPNHPQVFAAAGIAMRSFPWLDERSGGLDLQGVLGALGGAERGDVVLLHACCHNPTGIDPTAEEWTAIADAVESAGLLPLLDFAYQGLGDGLREDARGLLAFLRPGQEALVASSMSKNFALYDERVGALGIVGSDAGSTDALLSYAKAAVRANYSNPPAHGGEIVATILADDALRTRWEDEVRVMRERINGNRRSFVDGLRAAGVPGDHERLLVQRGMFSLLGLSEEQVRRLKEEHAVYVVGRGRVNVAGITRANLEVVCRALAAVS